MKKGLKILIGILVGIVGITIILALVVSPIAKNYIEKNDVKLFGREITMERLHVNIFNGKVEINGFKASEANLHDQFLTFDTLAVDMQPLRLLHKNVRFNHILLSGLDGRIETMQDGFNFTDLITRFSKKDKKKDNTPSAWTVALYDVILRNGTITYADDIRGKAWQLDGLKLSVPGLTFGGDTTHAGLAFHFTEGGSFVTQAKYDPQTNRYNVDLNLEDINLSMALPFVKDFLALQQMDGALSGNIVLDGSLAQPTDIDVAGNVIVKQLSGVLEGGGQFIDVAQLNLNVDSINPSQRKYVFNEINVNALDFNFELAKDNNTISKLLRTNSSDSVASDKQTDSVSQPINLVIKHFALTNSQIEFSDHTLFSPMNYQLKDIQAKAENFTLTGSNNLHLRAQLPNGGSLNANWVGGLSLKHTDQNLQLVIKNLAMEQLSPYVEYYVGNKLEGGTLSFVSENSIKSGMLKGDNRVDIYQCLVGKKNKELNAEYSNIPLKLGVSLLQDLDKRILFNIPVSGDINSPHFSYGKIVWKAVSNIILKAVASPFLAIAQASGVNGSEIKTLEIDPLQPDFTSKQYNNLQKVYDLVADNEELTLVLTQQFNLVPTMQQMGVFNFKKGLYFEQNPNKDTRLSLSDWQNISQIKESSTALINYSDKQTQTKGKTMKQKVAMAYSSDTLQQQVLQLAEIRNRHLVDYLVHKKGLSAERIIVRTLSDEDLKNYTGKSCYDVEFQLPDDAAFTLSTDDED
ncbi:MAG: DUF748 domain-containing protein [Bacteroidales bacterium]|nr:DUF748 domain-containing protein [Bacteroidales bacterium]